ncbi:NIL domain protein, partial [Gilliamella apicola SCGC AB-598-I20]
RQFIQSTFPLTIPDDYLVRLTPEHKEGLNPLVRLEFSGVSVDLPLLSQIAKEFQVDSNIISAQMDYAGGVKFGLMLTEMKGTQKSTAAAIAFLENNNTKVEVLGYV